MKVVIGRDGKVEYLETAPDAPLFPEAVRRRASHIEPVGLLARVAFHVVRRCVGDRSMAAEWTRGWRVAWRVNLGLSGGPVLGPFGDRVAAVAAEEGWLIAHRLGVEHGKDSVFAERV